MTELRNNAAKGRIIAVCSAPKKGMIKHDIGEGTLIEGIGLEGDAHAGFMHRQVSLIAMEDIRTMMAKLPNLVPGSFAENLTTEGFDLGALKIGDRLHGGLRPRRAENRRQAPRRRDAARGLADRQGVPFALRGLQADRRVHNAEEGHLHEGAQGRARQKGRRDRIRGIRQGPPERRPLFYERLNHGRRTRTQA